MKHPEYLISAPISAPTALDCGRTPDISSGGILAATWAVDDRNYGHEAMQSDYLT
jgi:hypothetical protein